MKKFSCSEAGVPCDWVIFGEDEDDLVSRARDHDAQAHPRHPLKDNEVAIRRAIRQV